MKGAPDAKPKLYRRGKFVCTLEPGDDWSFIGDQLIILNKNRKPRVIYHDGSVHEMEI